MAHVLHLVGDYYHVKLHYSYEPPFFTRLASETEGDDSYTAKLNEWGLGVD